MTKKLTYGEQLRHPNWQRKRLTMLESAGWQCALCEAKENTLHVHHKHYVKGRMAWEYDDAELVVLCDKCHLSEHELKDLLGQMLGASTAWDATRTAVGLVGGFLAATYDDCGYGHRAKDADQCYYSLGVLAHAISVIDAHEVAAFIRDGWARHMHLNDTPDEIGAVLHEALKRLDRIAANAPSGN